jgi:hypothetical protein
MSRRIAAFCAAHISDQGPSTLAELARAAVDAEITQARNPETAVRAAIRDDRRIMARPDERYDTAVRLLDGATLTHRVRFSPRGRQELFAGRELAPFTECFTDGRLSLASGGVVHLAPAGAPAWCGPPGWLPDVAAGTLLALTINGGRLSVRPVTLDSAAITGRVRLLRTTLARHAGWLTGRLPSLGVPLTRTVLSALVEVPDLLAEPLPPLDEVLALPAEPWADPWADEIVQARRDGETLLIPGVPNGLAAELRERAELNGLPLSDYVIMQLAANAWRLQPPCQHQPEFPHSREWQWPPEDDAEVIPFERWDEER